jgi:transposase-like protein
MATDTDKRGYRIFSNVEKLNMGEAVVKGTHGNVKETEKYFGVASSQLSRYRKMYEAVQRNQQQRAVQTVAPNHAKTTPHNPGQLLLAQQQVSALQEELALRTHERDILQKLLMAVGESL